MIDLSKDTLSNTPEKREVLNLRPATVPGRHEEPEEPTTAAKRMQEQDTGSTAELRTPELIPEAEPEEPERMQEQEQNPTPAKQMQAAALRKEPEGYRNKPYEDVLRIVKLIENPITRLTEKQEVIRDLDKYALPHPDNTSYLLQTLNDTDICARVIDEAEGWIYADTTATPEEEPDRKIVWKFWDGTAYTTNPTAPRMLITAVIDSIQSEIKHITDFYNEQKNPATTDPKLLAQITKDMMQARRRLAEYKNDKKIKGVLNTLATSKEIRRDFQTEAHHEFLSLENVIYNTENGDLIIRDADTCINAEIKPQLPCHKLEGREYVPDAKTPLFDKFLRDLMTINQDPKLTPEEVERLADEGVRNMWDYLAYLLTPGNPENVLFLMIGNGGTGKSELWKIISYVLTAAEVMHPAISELYSGKDGHLDGLNQAAAKRLVCYDEGSGDASPRAPALSINLLKNLTSGGTTAALRGMMKRTKEQPILCKLVLCMNDAPRFDNGIDDGMRRRIIVIPCLHSIPAEKRILNYSKHIADAEGNAIISRMIDTHRRYLERTGKKEIPGAEPTTDAKQMQEQDTAAGMFERPGLPTIPEYWRQYAAVKITGDLIASFLFSAYAPVTEPADRTTENRVYKQELYNSLIAYARDICASEELTFTQSGNLSSGDKRKLADALRLMGYMTGDFIDPHAYGKAYVYLKRRTGVIHARID